MPAGFGRPRAESSDLCYQLPGERLVWGCAEVERSGPDRRVLLHRPDFRRHPLSQPISQIHVTEEARHVAFARSYLRLNVPKLSDERRTEMSLAVPEILGRMVKLMMEPPEHIIATYNIPQDVIDEAFTNNPAHRNVVVASLAKIRPLRGELGLLPD